MERSTPILKVNSLTYAPEDGARILSGVRFQVARGERVALVGANGAGKTTTLRCVARIIDDWTGEITINGRDARRLSRMELARKVAYVAQFSPTFGTHAAREIVRFGRIPRRSLFSRFTAEDEEAVDDAIRRVGACAFASRPINTLSGGERQKILVAAAFAQEPELLLLDEPTTFLDYRSQSEISDAIAQWLDDVGAAALETTHDLNRVALTADRVVALRSGETALEAPARDATSTTALRVVFGRELRAVDVPDLGVRIVLPDARVEPQSKKNDRQTPDQQASNAASYARNHAENDESGDSRRESKRRAQLATRRILWLLAAALVAAIVLPLLGRTCYSFDVWRRFPTPERPIASLDSYAKIFWGERLPKTLLAELAGAGLALAGLALQTLFRNPLATPYTLGIASGSSFGATLAIYCSGALALLGLGSSTLGMPTLVWFSALGACVATALVYGLSNRARTQDRALLAGVAVGFFFSSLTLFGQYLANPTKTHAAIRWTTGGLDLCEPRYLGVTLLAVVGGFTVLQTLSRALDALLLGDERATSLGIDVRRLKLTLFATSSFLVGVVVAFCGPIGFVGLTAPHIARLWVGESHAKLVSGSLLIGALFLALCHTFARIALFPVVIPVGVVTSLLGGPFFLWLLLRRSNAR